MKNIKRIFSVMLVAALAFVFTGCLHKKDEIAVKAGDIEFTSAYYMCALINADSEAKTKVNEELSEEEQSSEVDYYSKKIDDKDYTDWVKDTAVENLKKIAAYKMLCKEKDLEIEKEDSDNAEAYASMYWSNYGLSAYFEPNGVGLSTYTQYMKDSYYSSVYFEHLYGAEGEKALAADDVKTAIYDNFIIANIIEVSFSDKEEEDITSLKEKMNGYVTSLKDGTKTFEEVYKDYNGTSDADDTAQDSASDESAPKDKYASILGKEGTTYEYDHYETVKAMANGEVKLIELEDNAGLVLAVKRDITADSYYIDNLDLTARHILADEEYEKTVNDYAAKLSVDINKYAVNQFKVEKIKEPSYQ